MKINFLEIAQIELGEAIEYYNYEVPGLGDAFLTEVLNALDRTVILLEKNWMAGHVIRVI
jgi:hypothetical protein